MNDFINLNETILNLSNPLLILSNLERIGLGNIGSNDQSTFDINPVSIIGLSLLSKPFPKREKKIKKVEKNEDKERDRLREHPDV